MIETYQQLLDVADNMGWTVYDGSNLQQDQLEFEFGQYSPAGEDFYFYVCGFSVRDVVENIVEYAREFDVDEHVRSVMDMRGAPRLSVLVDDAREIVDMIQELADALIDYEVK